MSVKIFLAILAILAVAFGVGFLVAPAALGSVYGTQNTPTSELMARFFGDALLGWGLILWFARNFDGAPLRFVLLATGVADVVAVVFAAESVMAGVVNAIGWSTVLIYLFGAVGSFYFLMAGPHQTTTS